MIVLLTRRFLEASHPARPGFIEVNEGDIDVADARLATNPAPELSILGGVCGVQDYGKALAVRSADIDARICGEPDDQVVHHGIVRQTQDKSTDGHGAFSSGLEGSRPLG
ncbi:MAG: hypothetical protein H6682_06830 [Candidatus Eisenbacteria bacterium]|nr:hypothetical protein [Candidatus Eisenbacteria bacterium]